jgi:hypothetical protein
MHKNHSRKVRHPQKGLDTNIQFGRQAGNQLLEDQAIQKTRGVQFNSS